MVEEPLAIGPSFGPTIEVGRDFRNLSIYSVTATVRPPSNSAKRAR